MDDYQLFMRMLKLSKTGEGYNPFVGSMVNNIIDMRVRCGEIPLDDTYTYVGQYIDTYRDVLLCANQIAQDKIDSLRGKIKE